MQRTLIVIGIVVLLAGLAWPWLASSGLGRLPGDIVIQRDGFRVYVPITSCLLVSLVLSVLWRLFR